MPRFQGAFQINTRFKETGDLTLGEAMLVPTQLYVKAILDLTKKGVEIHSMAHITGGGLPGNIARNVPEDFDVIVKEGSWTEPPLFNLIRQKGPVNEDEMRKTFNLGIGFTVIVPAEQAEKTHAVLKDNQIESWTLGHVAQGSGKVLFQP